MLAIIAKVTLDPGAVAAYLEAAKPIIPATRNEAGCNHYAFARCVENPGVVWIMEEWTSEQALQDHLRSPHITAFLATVQPLKLLGVDVKKYQVTSVGGL